VPGREIRELRDLTRSRVHLLEEVNRVKNRMGQMCEAGNIKVSSVASDLFGVSGRRMLEAIGEGRRDAGWMADYARGSLRGKKQQLKQALDGSFTPHQRWMLREELGHLDSLQAQIGRVGTEIERQMQPYEELLRRLDTIPGVDRITAWTMLAELGPDMSVFPDGQHAASWAGMCPGNRESGGKRLSGRTRKANSYLRRVLCQSAWAASHTKGTYLSALYRRLRGRLGHNKAIFAVAHQILRIAYSMLRRGEDYRELGSDHFDRKNKPKVVKRLVERLTKCGYYVTLTPAEENPQPEIPPVTPPEPVPLAPVSPATPLPNTALKRHRGRPCKCADRGLFCQHKSSEISPRSQ
jgi:transposase